jgi:hypothetical protein
MKERVVAEVVGSYNSWLPCENVEIHSRLEKLDPRHYWKDKATTFGHLPESTDGCLLTHQVISEYYLH